MCNTTINGAKINTELLNSALCKTLEEAIKSLKTRKLKVESSNNNLTKINKDEKCQKCNRNCKTRAVFCQKGHWIHYACDKLSEIEIELIEKNDQPVKLIQQI
jgi:phage-related protein